MTGRYGKLGKLVDLTNDTGPPPAYTKIVYSKVSLNLLYYMKSGDDRFTTQYFP